MSLESLFKNITYFFMFYFAALYGIYMVMNILSAYNISRFLRLRLFTTSNQAFNGLELPVSIIVPAYNEQYTIITTIHALLQLNYTSFEVIIVNDGSKDAMLQTIIDEFGMVPFPEACRVRLKSQPIKQVYTSTLHSNLRLIDKVNGGKSDSLNAGINLSRYPLICGVDADSILQPNSLRSVVQPFLEDPRTIAVGGTVRIANGCVIENGRVIKAGLPKNPLALFQVTEYLRAFLFGRVGWSTLNSVLIISGAFGLFHKETIVAMGGYSTDTIGEDMELIVRMHRHMRKMGREYRIIFLPDPVCWTEAPEDYKTLRNQRIRWQQGLAESIFRHIGFIFSKRGGIPGWVAMPYMLIFELLGPIIEVTSFIFVGIGLTLGYVDLILALAFLLTAVGLGVLISLIALFLEEISFHTYSKSRSLMILFFCAILENFGYRQINSWWRLIGLIRWLRGKGSWGEMKRIGAPPINNKSN